MKTPGQIARENLKVWQREAPMYDEPPVFVDLEYPKVPVHPRERYMRPETQLPF
jgi:hypothetical protein